MNQTHEIRLVLTPDNDTSAYTSQWTDSDGQQSEPFRLVPPLTVANLSDLRWYLERYFQFAGTGDRARAEQIDRIAPTVVDLVNSALCGLPPQEEHAEADFPKSLRNLRLRRSGPKPNPPNMRTFDGFVRQC